MGEPARADRGPPPRPLGVGLVGLARVVASLALYACASPSRAGAPREAADGRAGADAPVYAAVLDSVYVAVGVRDIVLQDSTAPTWIGAAPGDAAGAAARFAAYHRGRLVGVRPGTERSFFRPAVAAAPLADVRAGDPLAPLRVAWAAPREARALLAGAVPRDTALRSITVLSHVGYDADSTQALVYLLEVCRALCGHGEYVLLARRGAAWAIVARSVDWTS